MRIVLYYQLLHCKRIVAGIEEESHRNRIVPALLLSIWHLLFLCSTLNKTQEAHKEHKRPVMRVSATKSNASTMSYLPNHPVQVYQGRGDFIHVC